jgi:adenylylsulfate kinase-like enzyme
MRRVLDAIQGRCVRHLFQVSLLDLLDGQWFSHGLAKDAAFVRSQRKSPKKRGTPNANTE